ncbi:heat-inducible transcriptional repressor HrcA [Paramaledivibacter caminithermalis]|uniref:Heat-inducible transcription repressor HrcA n=1 Tax=Paramaledivibacter caminithermalis (strain DSM 15212 / CIP 107654 / DViRD3) TaxID=1121301 RepID=A0A1M6M6P8_PARC5|nr:heat-inducible transcriptional repressor HrcA [Paramaledivibacter caminithermalis]SHJ79129.1 heat-inducible transcription repressor HrcA [Paramaledivibacter caminithermalis DSM 15212]
MTLVERKLKILQAIINDFISTAQPIGSRTIAKKYDLGISSATIRNEMSDLEELGYLVQPHTSAGRIPSDLGYRLYVDSLMKKYELENRQKKIIKDLLLSQIVEIDDVIKNTSRILSQITKLTSISLSPQFKSSRLKNIKLVQVDNDKVLLVLVSNTGIVKNAILRINNVSQGVLNKVSNLLQDKLSGKTIADLDDKIKDKIKNELIDYSSTIDTILLKLDNCLVDMNESEIYLEGITNIFNLPEYTDINKAKKFISIMEKKDLMYEILKNDKSDNICIRIGNENEIDDIKDCSIVTATYRLNGKIIGKIGVIGPTRMDYSRITAVLEYLTNILSNNVEDILP